jgi:hypothetical protein
LNGLATPEDLPRMDSRLSDLRQSIEDAEAALPRTAEAAAPLVQPSALDEAEPLVLTGDWLWAATIVAAAFSLLIAAVIFVSAGWTIYQTLYEPNKKFGLLADEVALFLAAFGSGGVAGAMSVLSWWGVEPTAKES